MSSTINGLIKRPRPAKKYKSRTWLSGSPQVAGRCIKVGIRTPKKPNSAQRKVCTVSVKVSNRSSGQKKRNITRLITAYIPYENHTVKEHDLLLIRNNPKKDLPGINTEVIRGTRSAAGVKDRKKGRSKTGTKKPQAAKR